MLLTDLHIYATIDGVQIHNTLIAVTGQFLWMNHSAEDAIESR